MDDNVKLLEILKNSVKAENHLFEMMKSENKHKDEYEDYNNMLSAYSKASNRTARKITQRILEQVKGNKRKLATLNRVLDRGVEASMRWFRLAELYIYDDGMLLILSNNSQNKFEVYVNNQFEIINNPKCMREIIYRFYTKGCYVMDTCEEWGTIGRLESEEE
ncbi:MULTISPECIES: hypothetical protein [Erysipelotrichaceae]|uniref:hypothetical protein n=1 Tax=Erysipelotrichaceae TaxID=128827 RepID=UPI000E4C62DF|nr:hypothetical protein [Absiella sp. AM27-20]RHU03309.1 hypothetical protein DW716_15925 [Absiella sp. AM27-20]